MFCCGQGNRPPIGQLRTGVYTTVQPTKLISNYNTDGSIQRLAQLDSPSFPPAAQPQAGRLATLLDPNRGLGSRVLFEAVNAVKRAINPFSNRLVGQDDLHFNLNGRLVGARELEVAAARLRRLPLQMSARAELMQRNRIELDERGIWLNRREFLRQPTGWQRFWGRVRNWYDDHFQNRGPSDLSDMERLQLGRRSSGRRPAPTLESGQPRPSYEEAAKLVREAQVLHFREEPSSAQVRRQQLRELLGREAYVRDASIAEGILGDESRPPADRVAAEEGLERIFQQARLRRMTEEFGSRALAERFSTAEHAIRAIGENLRENSPLTGLESNEIQQAVLDMQEVYDNNDFQQHRLARLTEQHGAESATNILRLENNVRRLGLRQTFLRFIKGCQLNEVDSALLRSSLNSLSSLPGATSSTTDLTDDDFLVRLGRTRDSVYHNVLRRANRAGSKAVAWRRALNSLTSRRIRNGNAEIRRHSANLQLEQAGYEPLTRGQVSRIIQQGNYQPSEIMALVDTWRGPRVISSNRLNTGHLTDPDVRFYGLSNSGENIGLVNRMPATPRLTRGAFAGGTLISFAGLAAARGTRYGYNQWIRGGHAAAWEGDIVEFGSGTAYGLAAMRFLGRTGWGAAGKGLGMGIVSGLPISLVIGRAAYAWGINNDAWGAALAETAIAGGLGLAASYATIGCIGGGTSAVAAGISWVGFGAGTVAGVGVAAALAAGLLIGTGLDHLIGAYLCDGVEGDRGDGTWSYAIARWFHSDNEAPSTRTRGVQMGTQAVSVAEYVRTLNNEPRRDGGVNHWLATSFATFFGI